MTALLASAIAALAAAAASVDVALDQAAPLPLPGNVEGVVVGNPAIAGVTVQNKRLLFVTGKSYGSTNLIVVGAGGRTLWEGRIRVTPDESDAVFLTRGVATVRFDCAPLCRRRPDLSDEPQAFSAINGLINARGSGKDQ